MVVRKRKHIKHKPTPPSSKSAVIQYAENGIRTGVMGVGQILDVVLVQGIKNYGRNYICSALGQIPGPIGAVARWARYKNYDSVNKFGPDIQKELLEEFALSYDAEQVKPGIDIAETYESCFRSRVMSPDLFADIETPSKERLSVKLADPSQPKAAVVSAALRDALAKVDKIKDISANFHALKVYLKKPHAGQNPGALVQTIQNMHDEANKSLAHQLNEEKRNIQALFKDATFVGDLKETLGPGTTDTHVAQLERDMLKQLDDAHAKATAALSDKKQVPDLIEKMQKEAKKAADELFLISLLYSEGSDAMRMRIRGFMHQDEHVSLSTSDDDDARKSSLQGITLKKLGTIDALSQQSLTFNPDGSISLGAPNSWHLLPFHMYHQAPDHHFLSDAMLIALAIKAQGHEKITMYIDDSNINPDKPWDSTIEAARDAYKACRLIGWSADNIIIKINNSEFTLGKLFGGLNESIASIDQQAAEWEAAREKNLKNSQNALIGHYKSKIFDTRTEEEAAKKPTPPTTPPTSS